MAKSKTEEVIEKIFDYTLEDIMGERFGSYSKYIIQDRAIPDARDGLKPVQRRILYSMYKEKNTYDHGYRKSAKTVGDVIGNYHPHGDSSIYDAMGGHSLIERRFAPCSSAAVERCSGLRQSPGKKCSGSQHVVHAAVRCGLS